jgi:O-antigen ligase
MLEVVFCAYLLLLLLRPQEWLASLHEVPILQVLLLTCLALWLFRGRKAIGLPQFPLLVWFVVATVISAAVIGWLGLIPVQYERLGPTLAMFAVLTTVAQPLPMLRRIMLLTILSACAMVLHGHLQLGAGVGWTGTKPMLGRIAYSGIFNDPNDLGQLFVVCIAFCLYLRIGASRRGRLLLAAAILWLGYGIYLTDSRGTMLAALAVLALIAARRYGKIVLIVLGVLLVPLLVLYTRFGQISAQEQSASERVEAWYQGFQMFLGRPLTGVGLGQFIEHNALTAHNSIMLPMAELGLLGFIPWFGVVVVTAQMVYWLAFGARTPRDYGTEASAVQAEREAGFGLLLMAVGFAVSAFFLSTSYKHMFFFVVALIVARFYHARQLIVGAPILTLPSVLPRVTALSVAAIAGMWVLTRVLL